MVPVSENKLGNASSTKRWLLWGLLLALVVTRLWFWRSSGVQPIPLPSQLVQSHPMRPVARDENAPEVTTLFQRLSPAQTGIDFVHPIDTHDRRKYLYFSGMASGGVAVGDIDNDQRPDIFFASGPGHNALYRQTGDFVFEDITESAQVTGGSRWGLGCTMVDINNDGWLDIYVCNYDAANELFINQGDGTFKEQAAEYGLNIRDASMLGTFADYDRDGDLDMYLLTYRFIDPRGKPSHAPVEVVNSRQVISPKYAKYYTISDDPQGYSPLGRADGLLRNNGDGTFTNVSSQAGIQRQNHGLSATWWDYDNDGLADLYVGNDFMDPDILYHNNGDGTFTDVIKQAMPHTTWYSMGADAGDVNNDGWVDFLIADMSATTHYKQKTSMGSMGDYREFLMTAQPRQYMRNALFVNTGLGRFMEAAFLAGVADTDWTWAVKMVDLDNDGWLDLFFSNGSSRDFTNSDIPYDANLMVGRTDWDLYEHTPERREQNLAYRNLGDLKFEDVSKSWGLDHVGMSMSTAHADLDRDGDLDLIVANLNEPVSILRNTSTTGHRLLVRLHGVRDNRYGVGSTLTLRTAAGTQTRYLNPWTGYLGSNEPIVHFGLGKETMVDQLTIRWPSGQVQVLTNLKGDQEYEIVQEKGTGKQVPPKVPKRPKPLFVRDDALTAAVHRETFFDDYKRQSLIPNQMSQLGPGLAWGNLEAESNEGPTDASGVIYIGGAAGQAGTVWRNEPTGKFTKITMPALDADALSEDMGALWFDLDSDGDQDLYVVSGSVECEPGDEVLRDRLYINNSGVLTATNQSRMPDLRQSGSVVTASDFDRDGDLDLFVGGRVVPGRYPETPESYLLRNDQGNLVEVTDALAPGLKTTGLVTSAIWSDVNNDGWIDLLVTHEWGPVKLYTNQQGKLIDTTAEAGLASRLGWWNSIVSLDIDGDADMDYVVGNFGLNTKYQASPDHPVLLYYGDFGNTGGKQLVEAEYESDVLFPVRGKSCSTRAMPFLAEKFQSYAQFAKGSLQDIYTEKSLKGATRFEANNLESGVLINDGQGHFAFRPLPRIAQIAPVFGIVATDVNGDGYRDLFLVQNFFPTQPETGRMDGGVGLLLLGTPGGELTPLSPLASGLLVPGDARSLIVGDFNGDSLPDFVVGMNDSAVKSFHHLPLGGGSGGETLPKGSLVSVYLRGAPGNPTSVGAKVTASFDDGTSQRIEITAGAGYLSQSPPLALFGVSAGSELQNISVRWPDGSISTVDDPGARMDESGKLRITQPTNAGGKHFPVPNVLVPDAN